MGSPQAEAGCTSIVARTPSGQLIHGRNLDFNLANVLQNLTCQVTFTRGGQTLYSAATFAGYGTCRALCAALTLPSRRADGRA